MNEIEQVKQLLTGGHGWLAAVLSWIGLARTGFKPWSTKLQGWLSGIVNYVVASPEQDDDALLAKVLAARVYRVLAFAIDMLASVKLPTSQTLIDAEKNKASAGGVVTLLAIAGTIAALMLSGCAHLQPGADPIVVRAEQALTVAQATFDTFLKLDNADRALVKEKAPAVHAFATWLREPQPISPGSSTIVARWAGMIAEVDLAKLTYKANRSEQTREDLEKELRYLSDTVAGVQDYLAQLKTIKP